MKLIPQGLSMVSPLMPHSPITTLATTNHASNVTTSGIFTSTASGTFVQYVKSTVLVILNNDALWAVLILASLHPHRHPPPNLILFPLLVLNEWSQRTLVFAVATLTPVPPLILAPLSKTWNMMMSPSPT